jgi:hypothetical protein
LTSLQILLWGWLLGWGYESRGQRERKDHPSN